MPLYTVSAPAGSLDAEHKRALARVVTAVHCNVTGAQASTVNLVFREHGPDDLYVGARSNARIFVHGLICTGPNRTQFDALMARLAIDVADEAEAPSERVAVVLQEVSLSEGMDGGRHAALA